MRGKELSCSVAIRALSFPPVSKEVTVAEDCAAIASSRYLFKASRREVDKHGPRARDVNRDKSEAEQAESRRKSKSRK